MKGRRTLTLASDKACAQVGGVLASEAVVALAAGYRPNSALDRV